MKKAFIPFIIVLLPFILIPFSSCKTKDYKELGTQAAKEFCDCLYEGNTKDICEEKARDKYSNIEITHKDFVKAFNQEGTACGITLTTH